MRAVVQRVTGGSVDVGTETVSSIGRGLVALVGISDGDDYSDVEYLGGKLADLRIFPDDSGKMSLSVKQIGGEILLVSQFTLLGDATRGRRPDFSKAAKPDHAEPLFLRLEEQLRSQGVSIQKGVFGAHMNLNIVNDGPVTILLDSTRGF